ncbi:restriction endonuclease subunit S [soil metagenome]
MSSFNKYPTYKPSGVEWLGEIPEGWELTRLGTRFSERRSKVSDKDYKPLSVTKHGIVPQLDNAAKSNDGDNRKLVKKGDFVINSRSDRKGSSGIAEEDGSVSLINIVLAPEQIDPRYCNYLLKGNSFIEEYYRVGHGIVADLWTTRYDEMKNIKIAFPTLTEQTAIANFLDERTAKIDQAIAQKEQLITLLKERKQIVIQHAVTKGLNPNAPMKDSGIEWIGEIPEHWEVKKLKFLYLKTFSGGTPSTEHYQYWDGGISWISSADVKKPYLGDTLRNISKLGLSCSSSCIAPKGSIVIVTRSGILQHTLPIAILLKDMAINQDIKCFVINDTLLTTDYFLSFVVGKNNEILVEARKQGATVESIDMEDFINLVIPLPPKIEQSNITNFIVLESTNIDASILLQQQQISQLKEYKTVLIDSAVTGKIKVG